MHKNQWIVLAVGIVLAFGLFCALGRFDISFGTHTIHRTVKPGKSVIVVETTTSPHFYAKKIGRALLGFFAVLGGTLLVVQKVSRTATDNCSPLVGVEVSTGVWPPPPEAPQPND